MAAENLVGVRTGAQPVARNRSLERVVHQDECWCQQRQAHGSQDVSALPAGNTHYSVPEKTLQRQRELKFLCLWGALLSWLLRAARVSC